MRSKDNYGNDQLSGQQVQDTLRQAGVKIDKSVMTKWMKSSDMIGRGIYSIPVLLETLQLATTLSPISSNGSKKRKSDFSSSLNNLHELHGHDDQTWRQILDINSSMPKQKSKSTSDDKEVRLKNVMRLKTALYSSYNQHQVGTLFSSSYLNFKQNTFRVIYLQRMLSNCLWPTALCSTSGWMSVISEEQLRSV